ncbi:MAG: PLP-dependent transferase [Gemmatimonadaceae bacterium]|nr:PLP-dependent transferase [Gemmatimonadaceae bacterium]
MRLATIAVRAGRQPDPATGAIAEPITLSTTYLRNEDGSFASGYIYSREKAPNRTSLESALAALDAGADAAAFSSGLAATTAVLQALRPGDHVICPREVYYGTKKLLAQVFATWGLEHSIVDTSNLAAVEAAMRPSTALVWAETPSNPTLTVSDVAALADIAHGGHARLVVDNTWGTPIGQRVLALGADLAMYSTTKYHGGHSDVLGGALVTRHTDDFWARIRLLQSTTGAVPSPFDAWLVHRGIASLACRFSQQCASASVLAQSLAAHPGLEAVHYPGLPTHPGHEVARRQMTRFGGMLAIQVRGGAAESMAVTGRLRLFTRATSLGGTESLVEHRKSIEGPDSPTPDNLLRLSVGLEDAEDLLADLLQALPRS